MARAKLKFRQTDLTRALKAARAAGVEIARIEMDEHGRPVLVIGMPESQAAEPNEWDEVYAEKPAEIR